MRLGARSTHNIAWGIGRRGRTNLERGSTNSMVRRVPEYPARGAGWFCLSERVVRLSPRTPEDRRRRYRLRGSMRVVCSLLGPVLMATAYANRSSAADPAPTVCSEDADCDNGFFCDGAEACLVGSCFSGSAPCLGQVCDDVAKACVDAIVTLDPAATFQTMTGWEATAEAAQAVSPAFENYKDALYDLAVHDLGLNRLRLEILSGAENREDFWQQFQDGLIPDRDALGSWRDTRYSTANDNADPFDLNMSGFQFSQLDHTIETVVLPIKQRVEANGESLFINRNYVAFTAQIGESGTPGLTYIHDDPEEYAEFVLATHIHLQNKYGWVPDTWEVILEPDNVVEWNGTLIGRAIVAAALRLSANGFTPRFVGPSNTCMGNAITYFNDMAGVPGALQHVEEISYHRYCSVSDTHLRTIAALAEANGLNTSMLEHIGSGHQDLHKDLKIGNNSAWQQFSLAWVTSSGATDNGGNLYIVDDAVVANPTVTISSRTRFLRQYFKFIRRGAVRMGAISNSGIFDPLAFTNVDSTVVVVIKAGGGGTMSIQGLPGGTYGVKFTTPNQYDADLTNQTIGSGEALITGIPRDGVITIYGICPGCIGDIDHDGRVDRDDLAAMVRCFDGPNTEPVGGCVDADLDRDNDVDLVDVAHFQTSFTGP